MTIEEFDNEVGNLEDMENFCEEYGYEDYWDDLELIHTDKLDDAIEERVRDLLRYNSWKDVYNFLAEIDDYSETDYHRDDNYYSPVTHEDEAYIINTFRDYLDEYGYFEEEPEEGAVEEEEESEEVEPEEPLELIDTTTPENVEQFVLEENNENNEDNEDEFWDTEEEEEYLEEAITEVLEENNANVMEELNKFLLGGY